ncbi:unnamed protein product [Prunus armeniaca]
MFMQRTLSVQLNFSYLCWRSSWVFITLRVLGFSPTSLALRISSSTSRRFGVSVGTVVPGANVASSIVSTGPVLGFTGFTSPVGFSTCAGPTSEAVPNPFDDASKLGPESLGSIVGIVFLVLGILFQYFNFTADSNPPKFGDNHSLNLSQSLSQGHAQMVKNNNVASGSRVPAVWNNQNTTIFCDLCIKEVEAGNRPGTHFKKEGWENVRISLSKETGAEYDKSQLSLREFRKRY